MVTGFIAGLVSSARSFAVFSGVTLFISTGAVAQGDAAQSDSSNSDSSNSYAIQFEPLISEHKDRPFSGELLISRGNDPLYHYSSHKALEGPQYIVGSISKQITAALVQQQIEQGRLSASAKLGDYLQQNAVLDAMPLGQLLNHTAGLQKGDKPPVSPSDGQFRYANQGYNLLGQAVEKVSGQTYAQLAQTMFDRCGMKDSFAPVGDKQLEQANGLIAGYFEPVPGTLEPVPKSFPVESVPSGGVVSTVKDLARWNRCLYQTDKIASDSTLLSMPTSVRKHRWGDLGYGAGLQITETAAGPEYSHSGYVLGYISTMTYYPKYDISLILLENVAWNPADMKRVFGLHDQLRNRLVERLAGS